MLYDIGFLIFSIFYLPTLIFKGKMHSDFGERFANYGKEKAGALGSSKGCIWIEAVSVGEVAVSRSLIELLKKRFPNKPIVFSTITKTGNDLARKLYSKDATVIYFPLDLSWVVRKTVSLIAPSIYIMIETEIWPNVINELSRRGVPCVLMNGRISDRSFGKYRAVRPFLAPVLKRVGLFCMQSLADAERIIELGAPSEKVRITGNMKFDTPVTVDSKRCEEAKRKMGLSDSGGLIVAGSTHPGEEAMLLDIFAVMHTEFPELKLLIAPRHIERSTEVEDVIRKRGFEPVKLSSIGSGSLKITGRRPVFILDTIGQLRDIYSIATVVFMGGSMVPHGGQNPVEPAALGKPVVFGPHMFNFREITSVFVDNGAAVIVKDEEGLSGAIRMLLKDQPRRNEIGRNAARAIAEKRGATERNLKELEGML